EKGEAERRAGLGSAAFLEHSAVGVGLDTLQQRR
ncbi:hypothetical protein scyTo_0019938, partial [Scyliorhinus torazame]|nr:hypothetical protein [Scyliorhinus torazame]